MFQTWDKHTGGKRPSPCLGVVEACVGRGPSEPCAHGEHVLAPAGSANALLHSNNVGVGSLTRAFQML